MHQLKKSDTQIRNISRYQSTQCIRSNGRGELYTIIVDMFYMGENSQQEHGLMVEENYRQEVIFVWMSLIWWVLYLINNRAKYHNGSLTMQVG